MPVMIRHAVGEGALLDGGRRAVPRRRSSGRPRRTRSRAWLEATRPAARPLEVGELLLAPRRPVRARRRRLRPPHVPLRPVGLGQDVLARRRARAAAARDRPAGRRSSIRTPTSSGSASVRAGRRRRSSPRATAKVARDRVRSVRRAGRRRFALALRRARPGDAGGGPAARPDRRPRGVRRADRAARRSGEPAARSSCDLARAGATPRGASRRARNLGVHRWSVWARGDRRLDARRARPTGACAASSSTSARSRRARSRRSSPRPSRRGSGGAARDGGRC